MAKKCGIIKTPTKRRTVRWNIKSGLSHSGDHSKVKNGGRNGSRNRCLYNASTEKHGGVTHHINKGNDKDYRGRISVLNITNEKRPKIRPSSSGHTKTKGILVREIRNCVLGYGKQMTGRLKKERIKKDVRYQESREVTLEWWDYNYHSRVTSFLQFAQNKSHSFKKTNSLEF